MLILIAGLPGSGKSFFGKRLADAIGATYLNSDRVRLDLDAKGKYTDHDKLTVYQQIADKTYEALNDGLDVVVDATFYRRSLRELFERFDNIYNVGLYLIEVRAEESTIRKRLSVGRDLSEADFKVYEKIRDEFEEITEPHLTLKSTDDNIEKMLGDALSYIQHEG